MYTGRVIDELMETVERVEEHAEAREEQVPVYLQPAFGRDYSFADELLGVA